VHAPTPQLNDRQRWPRRAISVGMLFLMAGILTPTAPFWLLLLFGIDLISGRSLARAGAFFLWYLVHSVLGVLAAAAYGLLQLVGRLRGDRWAQRHHALQHWWSGQLFLGLRVLFDLQLELDARTEGPARPLILLSRHVSTGDTVLPLVAFAIPHQLQVRYVLKRELLWDPCLDIVGQRVPNAFVRRGGADSAAERALVQRLTEGLTPEQCIVLFPEGTRFTPARRERILERLAEKGDADRLARARALKHCLPLRMGGINTLLDHAPGADLVFLAHTGLEGITRMSSLWDGSLVGRVLKVRLRRVAAEEVPRDGVERTAWLHAAWMEVDQWVHTQLPAPVPDPVALPNLQGPLPAG